MVEARKPGNEAAAIGTLKTIASSQSLFREGDKDGDNALDYGTLRELADQVLIDSVLGSGTKQGYEFDAVPSSTSPDFEWMAVANPAVPGSTGDRYFITNQEGVTFYTTQGPFKLDPKNCKIPAGAVKVGQ